MNAWVTKMPDPPIRNTTRPLSLKKIPAHCQDGGHKRIQRLCTATANTSCQQEILEHAAPCHVSDSAKMTPQNREQMARSP